MSKKTTSKASSSNSVSWCSWSYLQDRGFSAKRERNRFRQVWKDLDRTNHTITYLDDNGKIIPNQNPAEKRDRAKFMNMYLLVKDVLEHLESRTLELEAQYRDAAAKDGVNAALKFEDDLHWTTGYFCHAIITMMTGVDEVDISDIRRAQNVTEDTAREIGMLS